MNSSSAHLYKTEVAGWINSRQLKLFRKINKGVLLLGREFQPERGIPIPQKGKMMLIWDKWKLIGKYETLRHFIRSCQKKSRCKKLLQIDFLLQELLIYENWNYLLNQQYKSSYTSNLDRPAPPMRTSQPASSWHCPPFTTAPSTSALWIHVRSIKKGQQQNQTFEFCSISLVFLQFLLTLDKMFLVLVTYY